MNTAEKQPVEREESAELEAEEEEKPSVKVDDEGGVTVNLPEKKTRRERRQGRYSDVANERDEARKEIENLRRQLTEVQTQVQRGFQEVQQYRQPPQQPSDGVDPFKKRLKDIQQEQEVILSALRSNPENAETLKNRYYDLEERKEEIRDERAEARILQKIPRQQQSGDTETAILASEFPEVTQHQGAMTYAFGRYHQLVAEGAPRTMATSRKAMQEAAERFGFAKASMPAPTPVQQQKYGGVPAQAGAKTAPSGMKLTKDQMRLATARWPSLEPNEAYARWADMFRKWEAGQQSESE